MGYFMAAFADYSPELRVLTISQGQWGDRIADNIARLGPASWAVHRWSAPRVLPVVVDDPEDFLPPALPKVDLVLSLGETAGVAQLIPDIVKMTGAKAVIAPIDRSESLPAGLVAQLKRWLADLQVAVVFPKPFCSLTETTSNYPPIVETYDDPFIRRFARWFGRPQFRVTVDADRRIAGVQVERDSSCGCAQAVAQGLIGCPVDDAEYKAGMLHHHFPCLASMGKDPDFGDTLMHISGNVMKDNVSKQVKPFKQTLYIAPGMRSEESKKKQTGRE